MILLSPRRAVLAALALSTIGCGGGGGDGGTTAPPGQEPGTTATLGSISPNVPSLSLAAGAAATLSVVAYDTQNQVLTTSVPPVYSSADAAIAEGGKVTGLIPSRLLEREVGHRAITELIVTKDMFERKQQMIDRADAFVILPGGLGTLDELLEVVTLRQLGYHAKPIVLVNLGGYWDPLAALVDRVIEQKFADPSARTLYRMVDTIEEVLPALGIDAPPRTPLRVAQAD